MTWLDHGGPLPATPGEYRPLDGCPHCDDLEYGVCPKHDAKRCQHYGCRGDAAHWCDDCERAACRYHSAPCDKCDRRAYDCCGKWWSDGDLPWSRSVVLCKNCK